MEMEFLLNGNLNGVTSKILIGRILHGFMIGDITPIFGKIIGV
jgi:hypothetical protein